MRVFQCNPWLCGAHYQEIHLSPYISHTIKVIFSPPYSSFLSHLILLQMHETNITMIILNYIAHRLLPARNYSKHFNIITFQSILLFPFFTGGNSDTHVLIRVPKVIQIVSSGAGFKPRNLSFPLHMCYKTFRCSI